MSVAIFLFILLFYDQQIYLQIYVAIFLYILLFYDQQIYLQKCLWLFHF